MNRTDIINLYAKKIKAKSYLEIGVNSVNQNFNRVDIVHKIGVDSGAEGIFEATHIMTSDEYFRQNTQIFDIIFIDGLHKYEQVSRDINNSLNFLNDNGVIICHDMNPVVKEHQLSIDDPARHKYIEEQKLLGNLDYGSWTGDCWKSFVYLRSTRSDLEMFVIDTDFGVGIIRKGHQQLIEITEELTYEYLEKNRIELLNLISLEEFLKIL